MSVIDQLWDSAARGWVFLDVSRPEFDYLCLHVRFPKEMMPCTYPPDLYVIQLILGDQFWITKVFFFKKKKTLIEEKGKFEIYVNSLLERNVLLLN